MRKERKILESIKDAGTIPPSITDLYNQSKYDTGIISNRNSMIYLLDIPDTIKGSLPSNAQRWCVRSDSLDTEFNRWLWIVGSNAPDLEETWKKGKTAKVLWELLDDIFNSSLQQKKSEKKNSMPSSNENALANTIQRLEKEGYFNPANDIDARRRIETSIVQRRGQTKFRQMLLSVYDNRCAVTGCDAPSTLEAAHISPYLGDHTNNVQNGLLLRADIHTLFDLGRLSIDPDDYTVVLAKDIRKTSYASLQGHTIFLPSREEDRPNTSALRKHLRNSQITVG